MLLCDARRPLQLEEAACQRLAAPRLSGTLIHFGGERGTGSTRTVAVNPAERMTSGGTSSI
jgi:hypothetical protein